MERKIENTTWGEVKHINRNCFLVRTLNSSPYPRCRYCKLRFHNCLFLHYQVVSAGLIIFFIILSYLIEGQISRLLVFSVFSLVLIYGYFFNKSTEKIIKSNFEQEKTQEVLKELNQNLEQKVKEQTKEITKAYEVEKKGRKTEEKARKKLEHLNEIKNQFIMATQHHLRTPLTSIQGYLDLLLNGFFGKIPSRINEVLLKIKSSTKEEIKTVEELLNISQFQLGKKVVVFSSSGIDIVKIMKEVIEELTLEAKRKNIYLKIRKPKKQIKIKADYQKLKVALLNIVDNAVKYTDKGGVLISFQVDNSLLKISIEDTGIGIKKEEASNLFEKLFERGKTAQKIFTTGRGIGLYISSKIIKAHDGKIEAISKGEGKGSIFCISLPIK